MSYCLSVAAPSRKHNTQRGQVIEDSDNHERKVPQGHEGHTDRKDLLNATEGCRAPVLLLDPYHCGKLLVKPDNIQSQRTKRPQCQQLERGQIWLPTVDQFGTRLPQAYEHIRE